MIRILTLSILTLATFGGLSMAHADSTAKDEGFRFKSIQLAQSGEDGRIGKEEVPRPKLPPGPRDGNEN